MNEPVALRFGDLLRKLRERAGLTQEELAEHSGLSRDAISALERGRRTKPHPPTIAALSDALDLSAADTSALRQTARGPTIPIEKERRSPGSRIVPAPLTPLIGRQRELAELSALLTNSDVRLLTMTGPGGVGKTRLAIEIGRSVADQFTGGAAFVALGDVLDPSLVLPTVADVLGVRDPGGRVLVEQIAHVAGEQPFLLILDNLEQLPDAVVGIADLVRTIEMLTVLVTSRAALRVSGERTYPLHPLATSTSRSESHGEADAIRLFVERAQAIRPDFAVTAQNHQAVAAICRRLDGLPLAIELAAARIGVLPPEALLARLSPNLDVLSGGPRDQNARMQSIRSAIAWSYDLLEPTERAIFRAISVFAGRFTLEAAETVLGAAIGLAAGEVLEGVASLIDKSLLRQATEHGSEPRYAMLFTIRNFGFAQLEAATERDALHRAHAERILVLAEEAANAFRNQAGDEQWLWFERMEEERANWRAALSWLHEQGDAPALLRLTTALAWFWYVRGPLREGRFWLERALALDPATAPPALRIRALVGKGVVAHFSGDELEARAALEESLAISGAAPEPWWHASALMILGMVARASGDYELAESRCLDALVAYQAIPHPINATVVRSELGAAAWGRGDTSRARALCEQCIAEQRGRGDSWGLAASLGRLSLIAGEQEDIATAASAVGESLALRVRATQGGPDDPHHENTDLRWQAGVWDDAAGSLADLGVLAFRLKRMEEAARMFGAAAAIWQQVGRAEANLPERTAYDEAEAQVRSALGATAFARAYEDGRALAGDRALEEAIVLVRALWDGE